MSDPASYRGCDWPHTCPRPISLLQVTLLGWAATSSLVTGPGPTADGTCTPGTRTGGLESLMGRRTVWSCAPPQGSGMIGHVASHGAWCVNMVTSRHDDLSDRVCVGMDRGRCGHEHIEFFFAYLIFWTHFGGQGPLVYTLVRQRMWSK